MEGTTAKADWVMKKGFDMGDKVIAYGDNESRYCGTIIGVRICTNPLSLIDDMLGLILKGK